MVRLLWFIFAVLASTVHAADCPGWRDYDMITRAVTEKFYDKTFKGLKWTVRVAAHREKVKCDDGPLAVAAAINALLGELKTSHTQVCTQEDLEYWALKSIFAKSLVEHKVALSGIW